MAPHDYYLLGRSGLRVSRLSLGTMTFGQDGMFGAWGSTEEMSRAVFDRYLAAGGNFLDTADFYTKGTSERLLGKFIAEAGVRDRVVVTSKFSNTTEEGNPNAAGNGRKNMMRAVEDSLRRLRTDYIDLYLLHTWDRITPAEEVMRTFDDLVRAGKIRYAGLSDVPGWYAARAQTWAEAHALTPLINLQLQYSLVERSIEAEFVPLAQTLGLGITAWSPLGSGLLSGKYRASERGATGEGRLTTDSTGERLGKFSEHNWRVVGAVEAVAKEVGRSMAQVALNWAANRPGVGSLIIGASRPEQLDDNLAALDFTLPAELRKKLDDASALPPPFPYTMFTDAYQAWILNAGVAIGDKPLGYAPQVWSAPAPKAA
ncbi:aldo/keto reductase [Myxococcus stipitatus]|uniref:aldo/keto reductase n=1 Tax=Myxococcus stipitatus TaxID=83455 RepID=UPI001F30AC73|nr:aldo/keto reductase [Myxococcus stipitatus]MCE9672242.1 aldo/keto reductase [Myxococcus stipitatus]